MLALLPSFFLLTANSFAQDSLRTLAGHPLATGATDGPALESRFNDPAALATDTAGNIYIADTRNGLIRKIAPNNSVTTLATSGPPLDTPSALALSPQGLLISDTGHHVIRRINPDGSVVTLAGSFNQPGSEDGPASAARFDSPLGLAITTNGIIYVADCGNHTIRAISPEGTVTTLAGAPAAWGTSDATGAAARFNGPIGLALDAHGNLFVTDSNNHTIRKITPTGAVTTFAGIPLEPGFIDGASHHAKFFHPAELAFDPHGALYVADSMNHAIRKISADAKVSTVTGFSKTPGPEDGDNGRARLYNPYGLAFLPSGALAISDTYNQTIRHALPPTELQISLNRFLFLQWTSIPGKTYQLQTNSPLFDTWTNLTAPITATQLTSSLNLATPPNPAIYRIILLP